MLAVARMSAESTLQRLRHLRSVLQHPGQLRLFATSGKFYSNKLEVDSCRHLLLIGKLDESYPCKLVPSTRRTRNSGLPSRTLSSKMFAKLYPRRVVPATGRTLKLVPYFNIISTVNWGDIEHFFHTYTCVSHLPNNSFICKYNVIV